MAAVPLKIDDTALSMAKKAAFSTVVGNALEWFDFATYAFFATVIARQFFPPGDKTAALMATFAVFGIGLAARPLGAVVFGRMGDVRGRKFALVVAMPMMGLGTVMLGLLPTYSQIGIAAPIMLVSLRLMQGFSAGGEAGNAIAFLVEWSPPRQRAFYGSLQQASAVGGTLIGSLIAAALSSSMAHDSLQSWGWRIPFLVGGVVIAPLGFYLRSKLAETPYFERELDSKVNFPDRRESSVWMLGAKTVCMTMLWVVCFYVFLIYVPSYLAVHGKISGASALWINTAGLLSMTVSIVVSAMISDMIGRRPMLIAAGVCFLALPYPMFLLLSTSSSVVLLFLGVVVSGWLTGIFAGVCPTTMAEIFPTHLRTTGVSIAFGLSTAIFGGFASLISETLIKFTGSQLAPSYFVIFSAVISLSVILPMKETAHVPLK